jgi:hypothetical protein
MLFSDKVFEVNAFLKASGIHANNVEERLMYDSYCVIHYRDDNAGRRSVDYSYRPCQTLG